MSCHGSIIFKKPLIEILEILRYLWSIWLQYWNLLKSIGNQCSTSAQLEKSKAPWSAVRPKAGIQGFYLAAINCSLRWCPPNAELITSHHSYFLAGLSYFIIIYHILSNVSPLNHVKPQDFVVLGMASSTESMEIIFGGTSLVPTSEVFSCVWAVSSWHCNH